MNTFSLFCQFCCFLSFVNVSFMFNLKNLDTNRLRSNSFGFFPIPTNLTLPMIQTKSSYNETIFDETLYALVSNCSVSTNCFNGECSSDHSMCLCNPGYAHFPIESNKACTYERKKKLIAFILELLIPYGSSSFYLGNTKYGLIKFSSLVMLPLLLFTLLCNFTRPSNNQNVSKMSFVGFIMFWMTLLVGIIVWLVLDLLAIAFNEITDGNKVALENW